MVWCCEPFGYGPYCLHPSGRTMEILAVGLSVECTLQKVTLDSVGEVHLPGSGSVRKFYCGAGCFGQGAYFPGVDVWDFLFASQRLIFSFGTSGALCWWAGYGVCL